MEDKSQPKEKKPSEEDALMPKEEKTLSQRLKEMPYDNSRVGQGFVMNWKKPKQETKRS